MNISSKKYVSHDRKYIYIHLYFGGEGRVTCD